MSDKRKKLLILSGILLAIAAVIFWVICSRSALDEYKKTADAQLTVETENLVKTAISCIEKDDMQKLFSLMYSSDHGLFRSNYIEGIFKNKDFAPAKLTGRCRKVCKSQSENILVEVFSEKRQKNYWISLVKNQGQWKIAAISSFDLPE